MFFFLEVVLVEGSVIFPKYPRTMYPPSFTGPLFWPTHSRC